MLRVIRFVWCSSGVRTWATSSYQQKHYSYTKENLALYSPKTVLYIVQAVLITNFPLFREILTLKNKSENFFLLFSKLWLFPLLVVLFFFNSSVAFRSCSGAPPKIRGRIKPTKHSAASALLTCRKLKYDLLCKVVCLCDHDRLCNTGELLGGAPGSAAVHLLEHLESVRECGMKSAGKRTFWPLCSDWYIDSFVCTQCYK